MSIKVHLLAALAAMLPAVWGCPSAEPPAEQVGGLKSVDFKQISLNGFDPEDSAIDRNDYAWSMAWFQADGRPRGYVYVGTGNDITGLVFQGVAAILGTRELGKVSARPPEIRRYREDLGPLEWERVMDYRDVEQDPDFSTIGFRHMATYRARSDGVNYLYAATMGEIAKVWRSATGDPGSWQLAWTTGTVGSVRMMTEHNGILYLALANEVPGTEQIGRIWATDGETFWPVIQDGFGNPDNLGVMSLTSWNNWLYAGTMNKAAGYEAWKLLGPNPQQPPMQIVSKGGPSRVNQSAITPCVFQDKLYLGSQHDPLANIFNGGKAADIIRIHEDDRWETVVGPNSISGYDSGFDHPPNTYIWSMAVHDGWLYAGTYDYVSALAHLVENFDKVLASFMSPPNGRIGTPFEHMFRAGADFYKSPDGVRWYPISLDGLGDVGNYGIRTLLSVNGAFYLGTTNPFDGLEIWRAGTPAAQ